jgi:hypothetical protein
MDERELMAQGKRIIERLAAATDESTGRGRYAQACEFLRVYGGPNNSFLKEAEAYSDFFWESKRNHTVSVLESFVDHVESGLHSGIPPRHQAELDVVSDFLGQADQMLKDTSFHPGAAAVLIGACLEEFLRGWLESASLDLGGTRPSIDSYMKALREADLLSKQDAKDLVSWAGIRNHAAHGEWDKVGDREKIDIMLQGVNLFLRTYGKASTG